MNLIGKIFVGLIAFMSLVFLTFSVVLYASHKNWKANAATIEAKIKPAEDKKLQLADEKAALIKTITEEKDAYQRTVAALKTKADSLAVTGTQLEEKNSELESDIRARTVVLTANNETISELSTNIESLSSELAAAQQDRAEYLRKLAEAVSTMHENAAEIGDLQKKNADLEADFQKAKAVLDMNKLDAAPELYDTKPAFPIDATVEAVKLGPKPLVMITAGEDSGLKPKHTLEVYRESTYLGRIEVVTVEPGRAVCQVLPQFQQGEIKEGDRVCVEFK
ncbi:MAG: hypothetical protein Q4G68_00735 [Planctomycetia bacterium]|nr:hypothetical protein [Planctomycetia bacterium]